MKKIVLLLTTLCVVLVSTAQSTLVATLSHNEQIKVFYGSGAFSAAHDAAEHGDIITLSGGVFNGFTITKAVTVRGTGIDVENPTQISGYMWISITDETSDRFSMEGLLFQKNSVLTLNGNCADPIFQKCKFYILRIGDGANISNLQMANCKVEDAFNSYGSSTAILSHCYINGYEKKNTNGKMQFLNCLIHGNLSLFKSSSFINCILCGNQNNRSNGGTNLPADAVAMNCVAFNYALLFADYYYFNTDDSNPYALMQGSDVDCSTSTYEELFKTYRGRYSDSESFELSDEAKERFLGTDGLQVGLYGGQYPFTVTPNYPRITKMNVAKQSTIDNKLSVEIEVSAAE